ncbi:MAG: hypothetical protein KF777_09340 [Planctomycetaceae bacterium]|nr:hypothetical protein [Planctomycetaceae bacterium]
MSSSPPFDLAVAHKYFAARYFNQTWDLLDQPERSDADDRRMEALAMASLCHWMDRDDCTPRNLSIGYWLASRVQAILKNASEAKRFSLLSLEFAKDEAPFYRGYAHEALARAARVAGDHAAAEQHLGLAHAEAVGVTDLQERDALLADLKSLADA